MCRKSMGFDGPRRNQSGQARVLNDTTFEALPLRRADGNAHLYRVGCAKTNHYARK